MTNTHGEPHFPFRAFALTCAALVACLGAAVSIGGWLLGVETLRSPIPGGNVMVANTAVGVMLAGIGLILLIRGGATSRQRLAGSLVALTCSLLGLATLIEYAFSVDLGVDQVFSTFASGVEPSRMAPNAALLLLLLGWGVALIHSRRRWVSVAPTLGALIVGFVGVSGYVLGIEGLYGIGSGARLAAPAAGAGFLLALATLIAVPERDPILRLTWRDAGGTMTRAMLPVLAIVFVGLSAVLAWLTNSSDGALPPEAALLQNVFLTSLLIALIWYLAGVLHRDEINRLAKTDQMLASKDQFVASVGHELRTPVTAVVGFAELLKDVGNEMSDEERYSMLDTLARQGSELVAMLEDLLVAARHDSKTLSVARVKVSLRAQTAQAVESLVDKTPDVRAAAEDVLVEADPLRVRQILRNLLTNAYRYGAGLVRVDMGVAASRGWVRVLDDGPGIDDEDRARVFDPYVTFHGQPGRSGSVGLGLPVARGLAVRMGGELSYDRVDDWTCFELSLPLYPSASTATVALDDLAVAGATQEN